MTKSKSQLRAEAIERLKAIPPLSVKPAIVINALCGHDMSWKTIQDVSNELIDLLTDDEPPEGDVMAILRETETQDFLEEQCGELVQRLQFPLNEQREMLNSLRCGTAGAETSQVTEQDTREKLEADITTYLLDKVATWSKTRYELNNEIIGWLDRQDAITTQECNDVYGSGCEACRNAQKRKIAELQEKVDKLEAGLMRERLRNIADNDVTVEVRNLHENAKLREKLSIALGHAQDMVKALIDLDGESE